MPQLYWAAYGSYLPNWTGTSFLNGRHLYIGQAAYRYGNLVPVKLRGKLKPIEILRISMAVFILVRRA